MKLLRNVFVTLLVLILLLACVFLAGRYGWKVLGFKACQGAWIETVEAGDGEVRLKGGYPGSFPSGFCGYVAKEEGETLYVGVRFSGIFGFFETGDFDITIPVEGEIREVILKTKNNETSIWRAYAEPEIPQVYGKLLDLYALSLEEGWSGEDYLRMEMNYMVRDLADPMEELGYAVADLDGDGTEELILGARNVEDDFYGKLIFSLYIIDSAGKPQLVLGSTERDRNYYAGENRFANLGSSGWDSSFVTTRKLQDGEMVDMTYTTDPGDYKELPLTPISRWGT